MDLRHYIGTLNTKWRDILLKYPNLDDISTFLSREKAAYEEHIPIFPPPKDIFRCFSYCDPEAIKIVILGQDPYHGDGQATGLCFGVNEGIKHPPSLKNIEKELEADLGCKLKDSTLEGWAHQGVLLLNSALTVRRKTPSSHMAIWLDFTKYIIHYLNVMHNDILFIAWGAFAYDKLRDINKEKHTLIVSSHPSPFSAWRKFRNFPAFLGSRPFSKMNIKF